MIDYLFDSSFLLVKVLELGCLVVQYKAASYFIGRLFLSTSALQQNVMFN